MTESESKALRQFIFSRLNIMYERLEDDARYQDACKQQRKREAEADAVLHKLEKPERITVRRHFESEVAKTGIELEEAYIQGLRDSVRALAFLGIFELKIGNGKFDCGNENRA